jgi:hypothetical protein
MSSFLFCTCDQPMSLTPSYTSDKLSSTGSSREHPTGPTHVTLKNEVAYLPKSWNRQSYLLSPCAHDARNTRGVSETGMDEARCESHPCCWNGTELQHLATFLLWKTSETYHNVIGYHQPVCISFTRTEITKLQSPFPNTTRYSFQLWHSTQEMPTIIQARNFCPPVCYSNLNVVHPIVCCNYSKPK